MKKFNFVRVAKRENKVRKLYLFEPHNQLLEVILQKLSRVFFKNRLCGLGQRGVNSTIATTFSWNCFMMLENCCVVGGKAMFHAVACLQWASSHMSLPLMPLLYTMLIVMLTFVRSGNTYFSKSLVPTVDSSTNKRRMALTLDFRRRL